ncbi:unnamed protein product [Eretmochelys imbricata]
MGYLVQGELRCLTWMQRGMLMMLWEWLFVQTPVFTCGSKKTNHLIHQQKHSSLKSMLLCQFVPAGVSGPKETCANPPADECIVWRNNNNTSENQNGFKCN